MKKKKRKLSDEEFDLVINERLNNDEGINDLDLTPEQLADYEESKKSLEEVRKVNPNAYFVPPNEW